MNSDYDIPSGTLAVLTFAMLMLAGIVVALALGAAIPGMDTSPEVYEPPMSEPNGSFREAITLTGPDLSVTLENGVLSTDSPFTGAEYTHAVEKDGKRLSFGIDVSSMQKHINWIDARKAGVDFVFVRAAYRGYSQGSLNPDKRFRINALGANLTGIRLGAYVYSQATNVIEAVEEAELLVSQAEEFDIDLPLVFDLEYAETDTGIGGRFYDAKLSRQETTGLVLAFSETVRAAGYTPMLYANTYLLQNKIDTALLEGVCGIWVAYPGQSIDYSGEYDVWQYSWRGSVRGISGGVDCDFLYS